MFIHTPPLTLPPMRPPDAPTPLPRRELAARLAGCAGQSAHPKSSRVVARRHRDQSTRRSDGGAHGLWALPPEHMLAEGGQNNRRLGAPDLVRHAEPRERIHERRHPERHGPGVLPGLFLYAQLLRSSEAEFPGWPPFVFGDLTSGPS